MSRVSPKSGLSPSATKGSSAIDLGKDSDVDMGRKTQPSITTGGIGVTAEVGNIGGVSVTGGVSVEISPIGIDISANPNYEDPSKSSISISGSAEIPGGLLGISGGTIINTSTGEIIGGSIGGEVLGLGINVSSSEGEIGVDFTLQIPFTPVEISLGFGFPKDKKKSETPTPTPTPLPTPPIYSPPLPIPPSLYCPFVFVKTKVTYFLSRDYNDTTNNTRLIKHDYTATIKIYPDPFPLPDGSYVKVIKTNPLVFYDMAVTSGDSTRTESQAPNMIVRTDSFNYVKKDNTIFVSDVGGFTYSYGRERIGYTNKGYPLWGEWQLMSMQENKYLECSSPVQPNIVYSPFPNPPPRKDKMDACCQENLKLLRAIYKGIGIAKFPGKLPATIIQKIPKKGEQPAEPPQEPVADWVDLFMWNFKRDDERWGQWEIQINVKDADLTKEGDQEKSIKFPNLAESVAEMEGQLLSLLTNVEALVAIQTKCLVESGMARQEAIKGYLASKAIIKYMAFKSAEIDVAVPMTFTPGAESISDLIKESEGHIKGTDYTEKETLRDILLDLLQAAAVIRAVHWQKIDSKTDTKSQLLNLLKGSVDLAASIANPQNPNGDGEGENKFDPAQNFEDFLDSAEDGFRNTTGITDIQNPYGKTPDRRPRIRQIGDNISQAGGK